MFLRIPVALGVKTNSSFDLLEESWPKEQTGDSTLLTIAAEILFAVTHRGAHGCQWVCALRERLDLLVNGQIDKHGNCSDAARRRDYFVEKRSRKLLRLRFVLAECPAQLFSYNLHEIKRFQTIRLSSEHLIRRRYGNVG